MAQEVSATAARGGGDAWARRPFAVRGRSQLLRGTPGFAFFRAGELTHTSTPPFPGLRLSRDRAPGKVTLWGRGQVPSAGSPCSATSPAGDPGRSLDRWPATPRSATPHPGTQAEGPTLDLQGGAGLGPRPASSVQPTCCSGPGSCAPRTCPAHSRTPPGPQTLPRGPPRSPPDPSARWH